MKFSVWDLDTSRYLSSGRNSATANQAVEEALGFLIDHNADDEKTWEEHDFDIPNWRDANKEGNKEYLECFNFKVEQHENQIKEEDEGIRL